MATAWIPNVAAADGAGLYLFVAVATLPVVGLKVAPGCGRSQNRYLAKTPSAPRKGEIKKTLATGGGGSRPTILDCLLVSARETDGHQCQLAPFGRKPASLFCPSLFLGALGVLARYRF